jgi:hypothetical protein
MDNNQPPFGNTLDGTDVSLMPEPSAITYTNALKPGGFDLGLGFGDETALENFDFDSFLQNPNEDGFGALGGDFDFHSVTEVGGDL